MPNTMPGNSMRGHVVEKVEGLFSNTSEHMLALLSDL
jgi:hypothetical protein